MKPFRFLLALLFALVMTGLGLAGGWYARSQTSTGSPPAQPAKTGETEEKEETISPQALKNMGVTLAKAEPVNHVVRRDVAAVVTELPASLQPVAARWGGTVQAVLPDFAEEGAEGPRAFAGLVAHPNTVLVEIIRAPLPRIDRTLTGEILQAVSESIHGDATDLRAARKALELAELEWQRVKKINAESSDLPVIPRQTEINLRYEALKARAEVERIEARLSLHGLTRENIEVVARGGTVPPASGLWKRALKTNGLWSPKGDEILSKLPERLQKHPWTFAGIGELSALGCCDDALVEALAKHEGLGSRFHELVALVQQGHALPDVVSLFRSGFLDPVVKVRVPEGAGELEVREVRVRPGQQVAAGDVLVLLADSRRMALDLETPGQDAALVVDALENLSELTARPLVRGAGPVLEGVKLAAYRTPPGGGTARAYAIVKNEPVYVASEGAFQRTAWKLRAGMRYRVALPLRTLENVFVFPRHAVVRQGEDRVVFLRAGKKFRCIPVHVIYEDARTAAVANDGTFHAGEEVVVSGAFALCLALRSKDGAVDDSEHKHGPT